MTRQRGPRPEPHRAQCVHHCTARLALASLFHPAVTLRPIPEALRDGGRLSSHCYHPAHLTSDMPLRRSLRHLMVLLLLCGVLLSGWLAYVVALRVGQAQIQATGLHRLELYTASLRREISKYAFLPGTLGPGKEVLAPAGARCLRRAGRRKSAPISNS